MIRPNNSSLKVFLHCDPVDMRKQMDGLSAIVQSEMEPSTFEKCLFIFSNKRRDKIKILAWEKNGFVVWYKRLEKQRFPWPKTGEACRLSVKELNMLLDGYDVFKFKPHEKIVFDSVV